MGKNENFFDPKSATVLKRWLDGNKIYTPNKVKNFRFGPGTLEGQQHFTLDFDKIGQWFTDPSRILTSWDAFEHTSYDDEYRINTVTRLIIVAFVLLIVVGVREWWIVLIVGLFLILILWSTLIPSTQGSIHSKKPPKIQYLRCHNTKPLDKSPTRRDSFSLFRPLEKSRRSSYQLLPKNHKHI